MSHKRDWTDDLPGLMEGYTEQEPDGLWEAVRAATVPRRRRAAAWWYAGGGLAAAAAIAGLVFLTRPAVPAPSVSSDTGEKLAEQVEHAVEENAPDVTVPETPPSQTFGTPFTASTKHRFQSVSMSQDLPQTPSEQGLEASINPEMQDPSDVSSKAETTPEPEAPTQAGTSSRTPSGQNDPSPAPQHQTRPQRPSSVRTAVRVQLGVTTGLMAQTSTQTLTGSPALLASSSPVFADALATRSMSGGNDIWNLLMAGRNKPGETEAAHRQSARFGVGLKVGILPRWGLETGLVGTQLQSSFRTPAGNARVTTERSYLYWGVPLYLHFDAFQWRSLDLYLAGGPMLEWSRSCKENQYLDLNGRRTTSKSATVSLHDTRVSLNLDAGLQWAFFEHNALFIQPGFSWHLPSEGAPSNYYSAHPAAFQLTLGYRLLLF